MNREELIKCAEEYRRGPKIEGAEARWATFSAREGDLFGADLSDMPFGAINLYEANLVQTNLSRAYLRYADLSGVTAHHAQLKGTNLSHARLRQAKLCFADLTGADLSFAHMHRADLTGADLTGVDLHHAFLDNILLRDTNSIISCSATQNWRGLDCPKAPSKPTSRGNTGRPTISGSPSA